MILIVYFIIIMKEMSLSQTFILRVEFFGFKWVYWINMFI